MKLDHVSYAVLPGELAGTVSRLGNELGAAFVDGGRHPRFGTHNFILALADGTYVEVVAPLDHPAVDSAPFGQAVRQRANSGGGWMGWVLRVDDLAPIESELGRSSGQGHRQLPDGRDLTWQQIGVLDLIADPQLPYFIHWDDMGMHPSVGGTCSASVAELEISGDETTLDRWLALTGRPQGLTINWVADEESGVTTVVFDTPNGRIAIS